MRFGFVTIIALASTITGVVSSPVAVPAEKAVEKRAFNSLTFATDLSKTVQPSLNSISTTAKSIDASSTEEEIAAASSAIAAHVSSIVSDINSAKAQIPTTASKLKRRQDALSVATVLGNLIAEISGVAEEVTTALGLTSATALLAPLGPALSNLLLALEVVVDDLLELVEEIVNDLLTGLAAGLTGITL